MSIPDAVTTGVVVAGALQVTKQAQDFIAAAVGHKGESIGTILGNMMDRRRKNVESIASKAQLTLLSVGATAKEVPLKLLQPALEAASLEEEDSMQERWANLLATAANPGADDEIPPSFTTTLADLSPRAARFLDSTYDHLAGSIPKDAEHEALAFREPLRRGELLNVYQKVNLRKVKFFLFDIDQLLRLQLLETKAPPLDRDAFLAAAPVDEEPIYRLTAFAYYFVQACRPPKGVPVLGDSQKG